VNVLCISLPGALRYESSGVIGLPGSGDGIFSLSRGHLHKKRIIRIELDRFYFKPKIEK